MLQAEGLNVDEAEVLLDDLLESLERLTWTKERGKFPIPYKTLLEEVGRGDLIGNAPSRKRDVVRLLQTPNSKQLLHQRLNDELTGAPLKLVPVLRYYASKACRGKKRERNVGVATATPMKQQVERVERVEQVERVERVERVPGTTLAKAQKDRQLVCVPGASSNVRASWVICNSTELFQCVYDNIIGSSSSAAIPDTDVGVWLSAVLNDARGALAPKLLRLYDAALRRPVLLIFDVYGFARHLGVSCDGQRAKLATRIALEWNRFKSLDPLKDLEHKQSALTDIASASVSFALAEWAEVLGLQANDISFTVVNASALSDCARWLFESPYVTMARAMMGLPLLSATNKPKVKANGSIIEVAQTLGFGLFKGKEEILATKGGMYLSLSGSPKMGIRIFFSGSGTSWRCVHRREEALMLTKMLHSPRPPSDALAATMFLKTRRLPKGLRLEEDCLVLTTGGATLRLHMAWYRSGRSGLIDFDEMFRDAYGLLRLGPPKTLATGSSEVDLQLLTRHLGFVEALQLLTATATKHHTYPANVVPIFKMTSVSDGSACHTQQAAAEIHRLTGRFSEHIVGYHNTSNNFSVRFSEMCVAKRKDGSLDFNKLQARVYERCPWITPSLQHYFTVKELCLLLVATFWQWNGTFDEARLLGQLRMRLSASDMELVEKARVGQGRGEQAEQAEHNWSISLQTMVDQTKSLGFDASALVEHYLNALVQTKGPWLVVNSETGETRVDLTTQVILGQANIPWLTLNEAEPLSMMHLPMGLAEFRSWLSKQARSRQGLLPVLPCQVRVKATQQTGKLIVFNFEQDRWHIWDDQTQSMGEFRREDFVILESQRCLPAPIIFLQQEGEGSATPSTTGIAISQVGDSNSESNMYWVKKEVFQRKTSCTLSSSSSNAEGDSLQKMTLNVDFKWADNSYYDPKLMQHQTPASERTPEMISKVFRNSGGANNEDYELAFQELCDVRLPDGNCKDWAMREFFSRTAQYSIWHFVDYLQLHVSTETLYTVFCKCADALSHRNDAQEIARRWALRAQLQLRAACEYFWNQCCLNTIHYNRAKLSSTSFANPTEQFEHIMRELYPALTV